MNKTIANEILLTKEDVILFYTALVHYSRTIDGVEIDDIEVESWHAEAIGRKVKLTFDPIDLIKADAENYAIERISKDDFDIEEDCYEDQ